VSQPAASKEAIRPIILKRCDLRGTAVAGMKLALEQATPLGRQCLLNQMKPSMRKKLGYEEVRIGENPFFRRAR
jgi:hypothetical protein